MCVHRKRTTEEDKACGSERVLSCTHEGPSQEYLEVKVVYQKSEWKIVCISQHYGRD